MVTRTRLGHHFRLTLLFTMQMWVFRKGMQGFWFMCIFFTLLANLGARKKVILNYKHISVQHIQLVLELDKYCALIFALIRFLAHF